MDNESAPDELSDDKTPDNTPQYVTAQASGSSTTDVSIPMNDTQLSDGSSFSKVDSQNLFPSKGPIYKPLPSNRRVFMKPLNKSSGSSASVQSGHANAVEPMELSNSSANSRKRKARKRDGSSASNISYSSELSLSNSFAILDGEDGSVVGVSTGIPAKSNKITVTTDSGEKVGVEDLDEGRPNVNVTQSGTSAGNSIKTNAIGSKLKPKRVYVPPIVVNSTSKELIDVLFNEKFNFAPKLLATCTKIIPVSLEEHEKIQNRLKLLKLPFHSYAPERPKIFRAVAYGVPQMDKETFLEELKSTHAPVLDARLVQWTQNAHYQKYVADFTRGGIDLDVLNRKHNKINRHVIRWGPARKKKNSIMICRRCAGIGHGILWCNESICCYFCAEEHFGNECPMAFIDVSNNRRTIKNPKCANCAYVGYDHKHAATDDNCTSALAEVARLKKIKTGSKPSNNEHSTTKTKPWNDLRAALANKNKSTSLPELQRHVGRKNAEFQSTALELGSFANVVASDASTNRRSRSRTRATNRSISRTPGVSRDSAKVMFAEGNLGGNEFEQLLSLSEVTHIALCLANGYSQCRTVADQIRLIVSTIDSLKNK